MQAQKGRTKLVTAKGTGPESMRTWQHPMMSFDDDDNGLKYNELGYHKQVTLYIIG